MLPLCDTSFSGIQECKRVYYYSEVEKLSNIFAYLICFGGSYRLDLKPVKLTETIYHYGLIVRDGVRGGTSSAIYRCWNMGADYDDEILQGVNYSNWLQIK